MPWGLELWHGGHNLHFVTSSCYRRRPAKQVEKLRYLHRNPVRRGLVEAQEQWPWSSFRAYAYQERGPVSVNEWSVLKVKFVQQIAFPH